MYGKACTIGSGGISYKKASSQNASKSLYYLTKKGIKTMPNNLDMFAFGGKYMNSEGNASFVEQLKQTGKIP